MTKHEMRKWLGGKSLRGFKTADALFQQFEPENLLPIFGTQYSFSSMEEARTLAYQEWSKLQELDHGS